MNSAPKNDSRIAASKSSDLAAETGASGKWGARGALAAFALVLGAALFQNCTEAANLGSPNITDTADSLGLVYQSHFDQVAYMSCSQMAQGSFDMSAYFTFRLGAYTTGGMQLVNGYDATFPGLQPDDAASVLNLSPVNGQSVLQASIRQMGAFQTVFASDGTSPVATYDYGNFFTQLGQPESALSLIAAQQAGQYMLFQPGNIVGQGRFETDLHFEGSDTLANSVRTELGNSYVIGLTYAPDGTAGASSSTYARSPFDVSAGTLNGATPTPTPSGSNAMSVYGLGLFAHFRQTTQAGVSPSYLQTTLASINEINLQNESLTSGLSSWTCPTGSPYNLVFRIVRAADAVSAGCQTLPDPYPLTSELQIVRRSLRTEDWYVDAINNCVVPKKPGTDCYGAISNTVPSVNYNVTQSCGTGSALPCVQFVSICTRNQ